MSQIFLLLSVRRVRREIISRIIVLLSKPPPQANDYSLGYLKYVHKNSTLVDGILGVTDSKD